MISVTKERKSSTKDTLATSHFVIFVKLCDSYDTLRNNFLSHFLIPVTLCNNILSDFAILVELLSHSKKVRQLVSQGIYRQKWKTSWMLCNRWCWDILRHLGALLYFVRPFCTTQNVSIFSQLWATNEISYGHKVNSSVFRSKF